MFAKITMTLQVHPMNPLTARKRNGKRLWISISSMRHQILENLPYRGTWVPLHDLRLTLNMRETIGRNLNVSRRP